MEGKDSTQSTARESRVETTLTGKIDNYNGVIVDSKSLPEDRDKFEAILKGNGIKYFIIQRRLLFGNLKEGEEFG